MRMVVRLAALAEAARQAILSTGCSLSNGHVAMPGTHSRTIQVDALISQMVERFGALPAGIDVEFGCAMLPSKLDARGSSVMLRAAMLTLMSNSVAHGAPSIGLGLLFAARAAVTRGGGLEIQGGNEGAAILLTFP